MKKATKVLVLSLALMSSLVNSAFATETLKPFGTAAAQKSGISTFIDVPSGCSLQYSYFGDLWYGGSGGSFSTSYTAKSIAYCSEGGYTSRQRIDVIEAKARLYSSTGGLATSKEDKEINTSYAAIKTDDLSGKYTDGYGNHVFKNAGYLDYVPESHDTNLSQQTAPY
ncbi:hypothetical protein ACFPES_03885 [Paenibacillus sp. GCM10023248]|uniref:hypothetical protein n=1 Tax=unclassified Paenibacillus TaxID=185978 RepID=UPI002377F3C5|nr:hypothetical protein [Paenibacillus sp. MAHUQ-63]MDD9266168.1 hypothetical protein [Paenibacillus sp. MAHUQ-63]